MARYIDAADKSESTAPTTEFEAFIHSGVL
jgi:hypothetical protein